MSFQIFEPSPQLSPFVRMYWTMESNIKPGEKHVQRIVPNGLPEITFYQKSIPEYSLKNNIAKSQTQISGQKNCHSDILVSGQLKLFSILFKPHGIARFFRIPASELFNQTIPLRLITGSVIDEIEEKLFENSRPSKQLEIVENFLINLLKVSENCNLPRISDSVQKINNHNLPKINALANHACLSRKQFERHFTQIIGASPKQFLRIVRFQKALFLKQKKATKNLTELAIDSGYYDQPHMISEFKQLSGLTPKQYFAQCEPFSDYFGTF